MNGGRLIHRADPLRDLVVREPRADLFFGERTVGPSLLVPEGAEGPAPRYLDHHRRHVFREGRGRP